MKYLLSLVLIVALVSSSLCNAVKLPHSKNQQFQSCAGAYNSRDKFRTSFSYVGINSVNPFSSKSSAATFFLNGEIFYDRSQQAMAVNYNYNNQGGDIVTWIYGLNNTQYTYYEDGNKCIQESFDSHFPNPFYVSGGITTVGAVQAESLVTKAPNEFGASIVTVDLEHCSPLSIVDYNPFYTQVTFDEYDHSAPAEYFQLIEQCNNPIVSSSNNDGNHQTNLLKKILKL